MVCLLWLLLHRNPLLCAEDCQMVVHSYHRAFNGSTDRESAEPSRKRLRLLEGGLWVELMVHLPVNVGLKLIIFHRAMNETKIPSSLANDQCHSCHAWQGISSSSSVVSWPRVWVVILPDHTTPRRQKTRKTIWFPTLSSYPCIKMWRATILSARLAHTAFSIRLWLANIWKRSSSMSHMSPKWSCSTLMCCAALAQQTGEGTHLVR